jgi:hypothetical protein
MRTREGERVGDGHVEAQARSVRFQKADVQYYVLLWLEFGIKSLIVLYIKEGGRDGLGVGPTGEVFGSR